MNHVISPRNAREALSALAKIGKAPVSSEQALSMSQQIGAAVYVETSARASVRTAVSAFEVAALAAMGKLPGKANDPPSPKTTFSTKKQRFSSVSPGDSLERADRFWEHQRQHGTTRLARTTSEHARKTGSLGSSRSGGSLSCKTRSSISIPSISSSTGSSYSKTPKGSRKSSNASNGCERMITIKCGRLNEDKTYEEIEVEVPAPIYDTIQLYNDTSASPSGGGLMSARGAKERRSLGSKLRNLFTSKS